MATTTSATSGGDRFNKATVTKAVKALLKWKKLRSSESQHLAEQEDTDDNDDFIYLLLTLKKIPPKELVTNTHHKMIPLPHPLHPLDSLSSLGLIIDDRPHKFHRLTAETAKQRLKEAMPVVTAQVLKLSKLKSDYKSFESKRKLYDSFDMFLADRRVVDKLPKLLGKQFYKKKRKVPLPVELRGDSSGDWGEAIERACGSALLSLSSGTCSMVKVGRSGLMESDHIVENVVAAIDWIVSEVVPKKWFGVTAFHLKFSNSLALPVYQAAVPGIEGEAVIGKGELASEKKKMGLAKRKMTDEVVHMVNDGEDDEKRENNAKETGIGESSGRKRKREILPREVRNV